MAGAALVAAGMIAGRIRLQKPPATLLAVAALLLLRAATIPLGVNPRYALATFPRSWTLLFPFLFWILLQEPGLRRKSLDVLVVSGGLAGLIGAVQHFSGWDPIHGKTLENYGGGGYVAIGSASHHLTYAGVLLPIFFLALGLALERPRARWVAAAFLIGLGILVSFARTAWAGAAAGLLAFGLLRGKRSFLITAGVLAGVTGIASALEPAIRHRLISVLALGDDPRSRLWLTSWHIIRAHPWFGAGLGSFHDMFALYKVPGTYMATGHPHNDLLNIMVETGFAGGLFWLGLWGIFFHEARPRSDRSPSGNRPWLPIAFCAGVISLLVAGMGQCFATDEQVAELWWFVTAAALWEVRQSPALALATGEPASSRDSLERRFKARTLPLAVRLLAPRPAGRARAPRAKGRKGGSTAGDRPQTSLAGGPPQAYPARDRPQTSLAGSPVPLAGKRILVVRQDNRLGNLLLLTPMLRRLREEAPEAAIGLLSGEAYAAIHQGWPWIDERIVQQKRRQAMAPWLYPPWVARFRRAGWDVALEASNHNTFSYSNCLLAVASGAVERVGFDHEKSRAGLTRVVAPPEARLHFSLAPLRLLRALGLSAPAAPMSCPLPPAASPAFTAWKREAGLADRYVVLHLGGRDRKAWPLAAWTTLLARLIAERPEAFVVVAGPGERERIAEVGASLAGRVVIAPPLPVLDLAHLVRGAAAFAGCDSGVMHLAVALETPTAALFFRSNPWQYAPLGRDHATVLLADPYRVDAASWQEPEEGMDRSRLMRADSDPAASAAGMPDTGERAIVTVAEALDAVLARARAVAAGRGPAGSEAATGSGSEPDTGDSPTGSDSGTHGSASPDTSARIGTASRGPDPNRRARA